MKDVITIATFNFQNNYHHQLTLKDESDCFTFAKFIMENDIDILGTQEMTLPKLDLCKPLLKDYVIYGDGRFGKAGRFFPVSLSNETNAIISKKGLIKSAETIKLPWLGGAFPRIITKASGQNFVFLNTHLDNTNYKVKAKQLDVIYNIIEKIVQNNQNVILTGDFNMTLKNKNFKDFILKLEKLNIQRVNFNELTCEKIKKGPIDHIFISNTFEILKIETCNLNISDHIPIMVKLKTR